MADGLISVLLTTYNRRELLERAVDSVLNGTYRNFELIILDDASTDDTERYASGLVDERIRYVRMPENGGVLRSRNRGFDMASGEFVVILDDDDVLERDALETIANEFGRLERQEFGILWFNCRNAETGVISGSMPAGEGQIPYDLYLSGKISGDFWMAFRKNVIQGYRFDERLKANESLLWLRMHRDHKAWFSPRVLCVKFRQHGLPRLSDVDVRMQRMRNITLAMRQYLEEFGDDLGRLDPALLGAQMAYFGLHLLAIGEADRKSTRL